MYPRQFLDKYWSPELRDEIFIAMAFDERMRPVYEQIIEPACIEGCRNCTPKRVDLIPFPTLVTDERGSPKLPVAARL